MKANIKQGQSFGRIPVADGWHLAEIQDGVDYMRTKDGNVYQNDNGSKAWKITAKVVESSNPDSVGGFIGITVFEERGQDKMATILDAAGLWKIICDKFPDDISVFDKRIMDGVKQKLPGRTLMVQSKEDKNGFANAEAFADRKTYNAEIAHGTTKHEAAATPAAGAGASSAALAESKPSDSWD